MRIRRKKPKQLLDVRVRLFDLEGDRELAEYLHQNAKLNTRLITQQIRHMLKQAMDMEKERQTNGTC